MWTAGRVYFCWRVQVDETHGVVNRCGLAIRGFHGTWGDADPNSYVSPTSVTEDIHWLIANILDLVRT